MKRLIILIFAVLLAGTFMSCNRHLVRENQSRSVENWFRYLTIDHGGLKVGNTIPGTGTNKTGSLVLRQDSVITDNTATPTTFSMYSHGTKLIPEQLNDTVAFNTEQIIDGVLITVSDTTVTTALGRIVYKTSNNHFYGCISTTATSTPKWKQIDN